MNSRRRSRGQVLLALAFLVGCGGKIASQNEGASDDDARSVKEKLPESSSGGNSEGNGGAGSGGASGSGGHLREGGPALVDGAPHHGEPVESHIECSTCSNFAAQTLNYPSWVPRFAFDGQSLAVLHGSSSKYEVDWIDPALSLFPQQVFEAALSTQMLLDAGELVLIDVGIDSAGNVFGDDLLIREKNNEFKGAMVESSERVSPVRLSESKLQVLVGTPDAWSYQVGPLWGPYDVVAEGAGSLAMVQGSKWGPATLVTDVNTNESSIFFELEDKELTLAGLVGPPTQVVYAGSRLWAVTHEWGQVRVVWDGDTHVVGTAKSPVACQGTSTAHAPDVCPSETVATGVRENVVSAATLIVDEHGEVWVATVVSEVHDSCQWRTISSCFESLPCDCALELSSRLRSPVLVLERLLPPAVKVRVDLPEIQKDTPALAGVAQAGRFSFVISDASSYSSQLHLFSFDAPRQ